MCFCVSIFVVGSHYAFGGMCFVFFISLSDVLWLLWLVVLFLNMLFPLLRCLYWVCHCCVGDLFYLCVLGLFVVVFLFSLCCLGCCVLLYCLCVVPFVFVLCRWISGSVDPWIRGSGIRGSVDPWAVDLWIRGSVGPWIRGSVDPWVRGSVRNLIRTICPNQVLGDFRAFRDTSGVDHPAEDPAGRL